MSFPKAKRFNEVQDVVPPVGSYDPKVSTKLIGGVIDKSGRFNSSNQDLSATGSLPSLNVTASSTASGSGVFKMPMRSRSASVSSEQGKIKECEKEIRRLLLERAGLLKDLTAKEEEIKKLDYKMQSVIRDKNSITEKVAHLEKDNRELSRSRDILKNKILVLDDVKQKKDLSDEVLALTEKLTCSEHTIKDIRKKLHDVRRELEENVVALYEKSEEHEILKKKYDETMQSLEGKIEQLATEILELKSDNEHLRENCDQLEERLNDLVENLVVHKGMVEELNQHKEELVAALTNCQQLLEDQKKEAVTAYEELANEHVTLLKRAEDQDVKWDLHERLLADELDNAYSKLASTEECSSALQDYRDALIGRVTALKDTVLDLNKHRTADDITIKKLTAELSEMSVEISEKDEVLATSNNIIVTLKNKVDDLIKVQAELTDLVGKNSILQDELDAAQRNEENLQGELIVTRLSLQVAEMEEEDLRKSLAEMGVEIEAKVELLKEACERENNLIVECDKLKQSIEIIETKAESVKKKVEEAQLLLAAKAEEVEQLNSAVAVKDAKIADLSGTIDSVTLEVYGLKVKLQELESDKMLLNGKLGAMTSELNDCKQELQECESAKEELISSLASTEAMLQSRTDELKQDLDLTKCCFEDKLAKELSAKSKLEEQFKLQASELAAALLQLQECRTMTASEILEVNEKWTVEENRLLAIVDQKELEIEELKAVVESNRQLSAEDALIKDLMAATEQLNVMRETCDEQTTLISELVQEQKMCETTLKQYETEAEKNKATLQWYTDRERELLQDLDKIENKREKEQEESERILYDAQQGYKLLESEFERYRLMKENEQKENEEWVQKLEQGYKRKLNEKLESDGSSPYWKGLYEELLSKVEPFMEQINAYEIDRKVLMSKNRETMQELVQLSDQYATLLGHQNHKQKIHYVVKMKEENLSLKEENTKLWTEVLKHRSKLARKDLPGSVKKSTKPNKENTPLRERNNFC